MVGTVAQGRDEGRTSHCVAIMDSEASVSTPIPSSSERLKDQLSKSMAKGPSFDDIRRL
jgi:hypothetical protein